MSFFSTCTKAEGCVTAAVGVNDVLRSRRRDTGSLPLRCFRAQCFNNADRRGGKIGHRNKQRKTSAPLPKVGCCSTRAGATRQRWREVPSSADRGGTPRAANAMETTARSAIGGFERVDPPRGSEIQRSQHELRLAGSGEDVFQPKPWRSSTSDTRHLSAPRRGEPSWAKLIPSGMYSPYVIRVAGFSYWHPRLVGDVAVNHTRPQNSPTSASDRPHHADKNCKYSLLETGGVGRTQHRVVPQQYRLIRHATHPLLPFGSSTQLGFCVGRFLQFPGPCGSLHDNLRRTNTDKNTRSNFRGPRGP